MEITLNRRLLTDDPHKEVIRIAKICKKSKVAFVEYRYCSLNPNAYKEDNLQYLGKGIIHTIDRVPQSDNEMYHFWATKKKEKGVTKCQIGQSVMEYTFTSENRDSYSDTEAKYLGFGTIYSINGIRQSGTDQSHFWLKDQAKN